MQLFAHCAEYVRQAKSGWVGRVTLSVQTFVPTLKGFEPHLLKPSPHKSLIRSFCGAGSVNGEQLKRHRSVENAVRDSMFELRLTETRTSDIGLRQVEFRLIQLMVRCRS